MLGKINQMGMACRKLNADAAIIAGDLYNLKNPVKNSHNLNRELIKVFKNFSCPIYMIEGNHDLYANQVESISDQPLGVLFADGTLIQLRHNIIEKEGVKISLVGVPFTENPDLLTLNLPDKGDCAVQICALHIYASLKSTMLFNSKIYGYDEIEKLSPDIFILGHYHIDQGIYRKKNKYFINIGSMSRGAISEDDIDHHPQIGYIKISVENNKPTYLIRPIRLKVKPSAEVFNIEKRNQELLEKQEIKLFVEKLASETVVNASDKSKTIDDLIDSIEMVKAVRERVIYFIHEASK
jgi:DNA repair exonuclease SbcCD nuclease subunit